MDLSELIAELRALRAEIQALKERTPDVVPVEDAAVRLKVSTRTMRRWIKDRRIPFVKLGNTVRIDLTAVRAAPPEALAQQVARARGAA